MIRIGQHRLGFGLTEITRVDRLDRGLGADWDERRGLDYPMRRLKPSAAGGTIFGSHGIFDSGHPDSVYCPAMSNPSSPHPEDELIPIVHVSEALENDLSMAITRYAGDGEVRRLMKRYGDASLQDTSEHADHRISGATLKSYVELMTEGRLLIVEFAERFERARAEGMVELTALGSVWSDLMDEALALPNEGNLLRRIHLVKQVGAAFIQDLADDKIPTAFPDSSASD